MSDGNLSFQIDLCTATKVSEHESEKDLCVVTLQEVGAKGTSFEPYKWHVAKEEIDTCHVSGLRERPGIKTHQS